MKAVMVMFDTLTRKYLSTYGNDWCITPNFKRLEEHCFVMENFYGGSMPCMPARRELHTGKYNFLHRSWGPLEPFDYSVFEDMNKHGIYTHLCTDHSHYFEDGGATYHNRYSSWEGFRGQEGDRWVPRIGFNYEHVNKYHKNTISCTQNIANKTRQTKEEDMSSVKTINAGIDFINKYHDTDNWFLQIECFDPHEPFNVPDKYREMYNLKEVELNWPGYMMCEDDIDLDKLHKEYASLITMCDYHLGRILDKFDEYHMWDDVMLIVNTDHGFLLGENHYLGKNVWPMHQEIIHTPFYIHIPHEKPRHIKELCQTIDIAATLIDYFNLPKKENMEGQSLLDVIRNNKKIHDYVLFGVHGGHVNITDGDYVYMHANIKPDNKPLVECTLMPTKMRGFFSLNQLLNPELVNGDKYSSGIPYLKYPSHAEFKAYEQGNRLYDVRNGEILIEDEKITDRMIENMQRIMHEIDAPLEEFSRLGLK